MKMDFFSDWMKAAEQQRKFAVAVFEMWVEQVEKLCKMK